ncbi:hypothetical protein SOVF_031690 isoform A [Spinacia oleracea]|uniref:Uncharacterized protein isoform X2 n=1 Tax=Spinacia oleracea TaxID=3562 RepID=A0ABM3RFZ1_SPIOL|nr:uncharacterized protein LOC110798036 isoform X2 [Spinacia oleracea]KNA22740.1 hypothetical protein SOVF_031690 isoform A [Spinacia oleracea]
MEHLSVDAAVHLSVDAAVHLSVDAVAIWHHMQRHEKELWHKRKFLMGLSAMDYNDQNVRSHAAKQSVLPESLLRKDDVFYEDVKIFVEKGCLQTCDTEAKQSINDDKEEFCEAHNMSRIILTMLDDLSNNGLCCLAKIVTGGSAIHDKTRPRPQIVRVIKNSLQKLHGDQLISNYQGAMQNQLSQLLKNPKNFRQNHGRHLKLTKKSLLSAFEKVQLQSIPIRILSAMYRRLKGTQGIMPKLRPRHSGWNRKILMDHVEKLWRKMIDQLDESDNLQHSALVKAMAVPGLYSKIASDYQDFSMAKFVHPPPEMEALQSEIVKAIWSLDKRFKKEELKNLQFLLDPKSKVDVNGLRKAIRNMLIDCLFECSDMDVVPDSLFDALSLINKKSCNASRLSSEVVEEEVECILNVGAHIKQLLWNCVPVDNLDQDFVDAYMEELEESDDGDIFDDDDQQLHTNSLDKIQIRFNDFSEEVASTRDAFHSSYSSATSAYKDNSGNSNEYASRPSFRAASFAVKEECRDTEINEVEMYSIAAGNGSFPLVSPMVHGNGDVGGRQDPPNNASVDSANLVENCLKQNPTSESQRNRYVAIQEVSDQASLVAYQIIGHVLAGFGRMQSLGLNWENESYLRGKYLKSENFQVADSKDQDGSSSIIAQAVHEIIPSFPNSQLERVKKFLS